MSRLGRITMTKRVFVPFLFFGSAPPRRTQPRLLFGMFALSCFPIWAQEAIPPIPSEPLIPTSSEECVAFLNAYTKVADRIQEVRMKCIDAHPGEHFDVVAAPMSCVEGGWASGKSTVMRACARVEDQWCRATVDQQKKFDECMAQVEENKKKKEITDEVILHKKPEREKTPSDDEIDNAFKAINAKGITKGQNKLVGKYEETGADTIKAMEKDAFSELDRAFRDLDFAELKRAEQPKPAPPNLVERKADVPVESKADVPTLRDTVWSCTRDDINITRNMYDGKYVETFRFYGDGRATKDWGSSPGAAGTPMIWEGTWSQTSDGAIIEWHYLKMPAICGTSMDGVGGLRCREEIDDSQPYHFLFKDGELELDGQRYHR